MSERELYFELIPQIAEIITEVQKMPLERYEQFKRDYLEECERQYPTALKFVKKVLIVIDTYLEENKLITA